MSVRIGFCPALTPALKGRRGTHTNLFSRVGVAGFRAYSGRPRPIEAVRLELTNRWESVWKEGDPARCLSLSIEAAETERWDLLRAAGNKLVEVRDQQGRSFLSALAQRSNIKTIRTCLVTEMPNHFPPDQYAELMSAAVVRGDTQLLLQTLEICQQTGRGQDSCPPHIYDAIYRLAWQGRETCSLLALGLCCHHGLGIEESNREAVRFYELVVEDEGADPAHRADAHYRLGICHRIKHNWQQATHFFKCGADAGNREAQFEFGNCCLEGLGVEQDAPEGVRYLQLAAKQDHGPAHTRLGLCHMGGHGVAENPATAVDHFCHASKLGDPNGQLYLGICLEYGWGTERNMGKALQLFALAWKKGHFKRPTCRYRNLPPFSLDPPSEKQ